MKGLAGLHLTTFITITVKEYERLKEAEEELKRAEYEDGEWTSQREDAGII